MLAFSCPNSAFPISVETLATAEALVLKVLREYLKGLPVSLLKALLLD